MNKMNNKKCNFIFIGLFLIFLINGCTITEENIDNVAAKMQEVYDKIDTIQLHKEDIFKFQYNPEEISKENLEDDLKRGAILSEGYIITKFMSDIFIEKPDKEKIDYSRAEGYITDQVSTLVIGNIRYNEGANAIFKFNCAEQLRKEPNFVKYLQDILNKYNLELIGTETISQREAYKLKLETDHFIWIDKETYLPLKEVNGLNELIYSNYKINEDIPDSIFSTTSNKEIIEKACPSEKALAESPVEEKSSPTMELNKHYFIVDDFGPASDVTLIVNLTKRLENEIGTNYETKLKSEVTKSDFNDRVSVFIYNNKVLIIVGEKSLEKNKLLAEKISSILKNENDITATIKTDSTIKSEDLVKELE